VVGIDLSGSARRPSGWAECRGAQVSLRLLHTDEEILSAAAAARPRLIAIDAPLSLPQGRCCTRDDCSCRRFGIVRESDRQLRKEGIPAFWSLLPSMQALTMRAISLAAKLRSVCQEIIEVYPRGAREVLGLSGRSRSRESELCRALSHIGYDLPGGRPPSAHELDALTAAFVGQCHLLGLSRRLGCEAEGWLMMPLTCSQ